jgi:hypothetical protein
MIAIERLAVLRFLDYFFSQNHGFAGGIHPNSNLPAPNFQNRYGDVAADCKRLRWASGQNEHNPLPPDVAWILCVQINIIVFIYYCVQESNTATRMREARSSFHDGSHFNIIMSRQYPVRGSNLVCAHTLGPARSR